MYFLILQRFEYYMTTFRIRDAVYRYTSFTSTGFHGFCIIVGTLFLMVICFCLIDSHFYRSHYFGSEVVTSYWQFADVISLFLFLFVY